MNDKILRGPAFPTNFQRNETLGQFFFNSASKFQNQTCQIDARTDTSETFLSVKQRSIRVALEMQNRGVTSKDVIVLCSLVTLDTAIPVLASFYLGAKVANIDPSQSVTQVIHLLGLVSPKIIFVEDSSLALIEESLQKANVKAEIVVFGDSTKHPTFADYSNPKENEEDFRPVPVDIHESGIMFFSSGTTGLPKAICHSHFSFLNLITCFCESGIKVDTILSFTSFYWISGIMMLAASFLKGGRRVVCRTVTAAQETFQIIEKYKVTCLFLAPILTYSLTTYEKSCNFDTSSLYSILTGGTPMSELQMHRLRTTFKHSYIIFAYGMTETGLVAIFNPLTDKKLMLKKSTSCGKVARGFTVKVVDIETRKLLGPNQKGEFCVKTPCIMKGYYNVDCSNVFDEDGFLKTGDVGYFDEDGCLYMIERIKEMFKYLSWHIVPSSIEKVLLEHPSAKETVVFGIPISEEEGEVPAACVVLNSDTKTTKEEIEEFVAIRVSDREKLRGGVFILDELPKTPSGKPMRKEVQKYVLNLLKQ